MVDYKLTKKLEHIAFIMDGNGRWAKKRLLPRTRGHKEACSRIIEVLRACKDLNIKVASLYAFSTENWNRPQDEIDKLFEYLDDLNCIIYQFLYHEAHLDFLLLLLFFCLCLLSSLNIFKT